MRSYLLAIQPKEIAMRFYNRIVHCVTLIALATASGAYAQIDSATYHPREYNDVPGSSLSVVSNFPSLIAFSDQNVSAPSGFANRHVWRFSGDSGTTAYKFTNDEFFTATMTVTLTGDPASPRKEAGFLFDTVGGQGQFIVNTDAHEVVAFGGPLPFYAFPATFNSGDTITLGMTYFLDSNGKRAIIYSANCMQSPPMEFTNLEQGIIDNSTLGGYLQVVNAGSIPTNSGMAVFQGIEIGLPDQDFDGVPDSEDNCPGTPLCTVVDAEGCSIDQLVPCEGPASGGTWRNHGAYVSAFVHAANAFRAQGLISDNERDAAVAEAAQSDCGKRKPAPQPRAQAKRVTSTRSE
jgi:hypothetical protein